MARLLAMYKTPTDVAAFDAYYFGKHVPLAKTIPGLRRYDVSQGPVMGMQGASGFHLIATLYFDTMDALTAALGSAEGKATAADLANFATGGVEIIFFDDKKV